MKKKKADNHARQIQELEHIVNLYGRRCEELEKLVALKDQRIAELLQQLNAARTVQVQTIPTPMAPISVPSMWPYQGCQHEYPDNWISTSPPTCKKCGQAAQQFQPHWVTYTYTNNPHQHQNQPYGNYGGSVVVGPGTTSGVLQCNTTNQGPSGRTIALNAMTALHSVQNGFLPDVQVADRRGFIEN